MSSQVAVARGVIGESAAKKSREAGKEGSPRAGNGLRVAPNGAEQGPKKSMEPRFILKTQAVVEERC